MTKELNELLKTLDADEQYDFFSSGVRERYPIIHTTGDQKFICAMSNPFEDTPKSLYRFLYLWEPEKVNFLDMYKSRLASIRIHPKAVINLTLYKYELAMYLYVTEDQIQKRDVHFVEIQCGVPGAENEMLIENSEVYKDYQIVKGLLEMTHDVYCGNGFTV